MKNIMLLIKGFIMGIGNIIPGVSGGTLALTLGIYERFIEAISHFFDNRGIECHNRSFTRFSYFL